MKKCFRFSILFLILTALLFMAGCNEKPHPDIKTTLRIVGVDDLMATSTDADKLELYVTESDKLELYITEFCIQEDGRRRGLWLIGAFNAGSSGRRIDNRGWYDVTTPRTLTVRNDFNTGTYSAISFWIRGFRGTINGNEVFNDDYPCLVVFSNGYIPPQVSDYGNPNYIIPRDPLVVKSNHKELIVTLYVDVENIIEGGLVHDWPERIEITTELR